MSQTNVGVVTAIYRYPVKSMRGEAIPSAHIDWPGLDGDRRYAFVRTGHRSDFPWLTAREVPALLRYAPYWVDPEQVVDGAVRVRTPDGHDLAVDSPELSAELARRHGAPVHLIKLGRGTHDTMPLSLISEATLAAVGVLAGVPGDALRLRPNIVVRTPDGEPFAEEGWVRARIGFGPAVGGAAMRGLTRIGRCMMVNLDPETAVQNPAVLRALVRTRETCVAVGGSPERCGPIRVGDPVWLE